MGSNIKRYTPNDIAAVATFLREGLSASQIAGKMDRSRSSVIGIVHRNKALSAIGFDRKRGEHKGNTRGRSKLGKPAALGPSKSISIAANRYKNIRGGKVAKRPPAAPVVTLPKPVVADTFQASRNVKLMELGTYGECKWPTMGEGAETLFCGVGIAMTDVYCPHHQRLAYQPRELRRRAA